MPRPRLPVPTRPCGACPRLIRAGNKCGFCDGCRRARKCLICDTITPEPMPGRTCNQCRETLDRIQAVVDKGVQRPPENELEHRVEHYAARAEQGLPLFDETRPIDWELV